MPLSKKMLRREMREKLARLSPEEVAIASQKLREQLIFDPNARVALFAGTAREPALLELLHQNSSVTWYLPKIIGPGQMEFVETSSIHDLRPGPFGILEPIGSAPAETLDVIVCPGLAFTREGARLGQGGGFYDRALGRFPKARKLGVAFACQIRPSLPCEEHDVNMDLVITPSAESSNETQGS